MMTSKTPQQPPEQSTDEPKVVFNLLRLISLASLDLSWEGKAGVEEQVPICQPVGVDELDLNKCLRG